uniref:Uncharacterized protein n=1 Tax=Anguilla anguilla TaxID=7936 RepID=A0A0E9SBV0_ANGAN
MEASLMTTSPKTIYTHVNIGRKFTQRQPSRTVKKNL